MRWALAAAALGLLIGLLLIYSVPRLDPAPAAANPPGNNGTIKVDGQPFDDAPNNEPHVGCLFQIDFYGFDAGNLFATVLFEAVPPTGAGQQLLTDTVFIGQDDNSGGGSQAGLDASKTYDLSTALAGLTPQSQQGLHVKLTVHADGSQGADTKFKVFWVAPCQPGPPAVIPESPFPVLLPLSAAGLTLAASLILRRRESRARAPTSERRAAY